MLKSLVQLKPRDVPFRVALRNTVAIVLPLALALLAGRPGIGLGIAAGALNTMFIDQPGPYRLRMQRMVLASLASGLSACVGSLLGEHTFLLALSALAFGVGGGLLVALGPNAGRTGLACMILLVINASMPRDVVGALGLGALITAGGLLQTVFAIAAWPLLRYRPEREAIADVCRQLAASVRTRAQAHQPPPVTQALLDVESLLHGTHRARGSVMETFRVLAELVERIRLEALALGDLRDAMPEGEARNTLGRLLEYAARALETIGAALDRGASPHGAAAAMEGFDAALGSLRALRGDGPTMRSLTIAIARAEGLGGQLRAAARNADFAGSRGELRAGLAEQRLPAALRPGNAAQTLRANLTLSSIAFRHALRCGVCLAIAVVGERLSGLPHGYWVPMTAAIVLKPDFAGTFSFGLLRVLGTVLGLVLVTALVHYAFDNPWERVALVALFALAFRLLTSVHYGIGVMMLTGLVVLLVSFDGQPVGDILLARGVGTAIGSALALAAYLVWPSWERLRVRSALADMLDSYRAYFSALLRNERTRTSATRTAARAARTNAQASLDRLRGEPRRDRALITFAEGVFANANRFIRAGMALEAAMLDAQSPPDRDALLAFVDRMDAEMASLARSLRDDAPAQCRSLREEERTLAAELAASGDSIAAAVADALDRMTDSLDTLSYLMTPSASKAAPPA